jgi:hypothetical protein
MFRYIARRREERLILKVKEKLESSYRGTKPKLESIPCNLDPRYSHLGLAVTSEVGIVAHFHVCFFEGDVGKPRFIWRGSLIQTKGDFHYQDYRRAGDAEAFHIETELGLYPWFYSRQFDWRHPGQSDWDNLYPGVPFIGENQKIPKDFVFPTIDEQFRHLERRLNSRDISLDRFNYFMDFLYRKYHSAQKWTNRTVAPDASASASYPGRRYPYAPFNARTGWEPALPGYLYLLGKDYLGLLQFGITNSPDDRLAIRQDEGWEVLDKVGPFDGDLIEEIEGSLWRFLTDKGLLLPFDYEYEFSGYTESWDAEAMRFASIAELLDAAKRWEDREWFEQG